MNRDSVCLSIWGLASLTSLLIASMLNLSHYIIIASALLAIALIFLSTYLFILIINYVSYHFKGNVLLDKLMIHICKSDIFYIVKHKELSLILTVISFIIVVSVFAFKLYLHLNYTHIFLWSFTLNLIYLIWSYVS